MALASSGRFREAIALCTSSLTTPDDDLQAMEVLACCYQQIGEHARALRYFDRALELGSVDFFVRMFRARCLADLGKFEAAVKQDIETFEAYPAHREFLLPIALDLLARLPEGDAATRLKDVLSEWAPTEPLPPPRAQPREWVTLAGSGQFREAIALCMTSVDAPEDDLQAMEVLACCFQQIGEPAQALRYFDRALELGSVDFFVRMFRARCLADLGDFEAAVKQDIETFEAYPAHREFLLPITIDLFARLPAGDAVTRLKLALSEWAATESLPRQLQRRCLFHVGDDEKLKELLGTGPDGDGEVSRCFITSVAERVGSGAGTFVFTGAAETIPHIQPRDYRRNRAAPIHVTANTPYVSELRDVRIVGGSSLVFDSEGMAVSDTLAHPHFGRYANVRPDPSIVGKRADSVLVSLPKVTCDISAGLHLAGLCSNQFGHWFAEFLPKLRHFEKVADYPHLPVIVDEAMPQSHYDFLAMLCPNPVLRIARGEMVRVDRLYVAPTITFFPFELFAGHDVPPESQASWSADAMRFVRERVLEHLGPAAPPTRKIYMSRRRSTWRRPVNEVDIEEALTALGFEILFPQDLDFASQVRLFQEARVVVASNGSALNSLIFAAPSVKVLVLAQHDLFNWGGWLGPIQELGFDPWFLTGEVASAAGGQHADYVVRIADLRDAVNRMIENDRAQ